MDITPYLGILSLICLAYLGHEEEKEIIKRKTASRASLVNIRGQQAMYRLHRVNEINQRTKHEACFNTVYRNRHYLPHVDGYQKNPNMAGAWKRN